MKLSVIILSVGDVEMLDRCRDWYLKLGLTTSSPDNPGESYWFDTGNNTQLGVHTGDPVSEPARVHVYLELDDLDEQYVRLSAAGLGFESAPRLKPWGSDVSLHDPVGHTITLVQYKSD